jgi:hypothetical protein
MRILVQHMYRPTEWARDWTFTCSTAVDRGLWHERAGKMLFPRLTMDVGIWESLHIGRCGPAEVTADYRAIHSCTAVRTG